MRFYLPLLLVNFSSFVPLYALNFRNAPNPLRILFVSDKTSWTWPIRLLYDKARSTEPFRIQFDYTFFMLMMAATDYRGPAWAWCGAALLAFGFVEISYSALMQSVFKRPPALSSDLSLLRSGLALAQRQAYWIVPTVLAVLGAAFYACYEITSLLFRLMPGASLLPLACAMLLLPPCLYHWHTYSYAEFLSRTVYSPAVHFYRNLRYGKGLKVVLAGDAEHFERFNFFKDVAFAHAPNVVIVCIESYGSLVHRDARYGADVADLLGAYETQLARCGYRFASTHSEAPIFAGGSWLSYASFTYGLAVTDLQLFDGLFSQESHFARYESLFHVLGRNGYDNVLLCPLGGVDAHMVDWASLDRCFQTNDKILFEDLGYLGPRVNYFGLIRRFSALDQYALNFGYERARATHGGPFSLFFCTLNSHYPWHASAECVEDWRRLNDPDFPLRDRSGEALLDRYAAAIRYQLDYVLRFALDRAHDAPLIVLFGDHQPPLITPEEMGKQTPVHVISRSPALIDVFLDHGFAEALDLTGVEPRAIRHEGFLSLLMKAMHTAYGTTPGLTLAYRERGVTLFDDLAFDDDRRTAR